MNSIENLQIISEYGDHIQLAYGAEFGYYASQMDYELISKFCNSFNDRNTIKLRDFKLSPLSLENPHTLFLNNLLLDFSVKIKLLDHSIFIQAKDEDWKKIDKHIFNTIQSSWRKFLANNIDGYREHFNNTRILSTENYQYSI